MRHVYMDYAGATPISKRVQRSMKPYLGKAFYNPSALYKEAITAKNGIEKAREQVARALHGRSEEIVFVGSGTESINIAIQGSVNENDHVITTAIEHSAVLETFKFLEKNKNVSVTILSPNEDGIIKPEKVLEAVKSNTTFVSVGYANNEIGVVQDIPRIGKLLKEKYPHITFHTDACQAPNYLGLNRDHLRVDLMSLDGGKIYGPKGVGALFIKKGLKVKPIMFGGDQERGIRPGTESVAQIVGFGEAMEETIEIREKEIERLEKLQQYFFGQIKKHLPSARIIGSLENRLPNNIYLCLPGKNSEFLTIALSEKGISVSPTSACQTIGDRPYSKVLEAINLSDCASSSLRFSMGRETKKGDIDYSMQILKKML